MGTTDLLATIEALPALPQIQAVDMLRAQSYIPTGREREAIDARADFFAGMGLDRAVSIRVIDHAGTTIGHLTF